MPATLYQFPTSPLCAALRQILHYKGVEFEAVEVDYLERKELLLAAGGLLEPTLALPDGETVSGSEGIALRLDELYPEPTILPPELRGIHIALARYIDHDLEDALCRLALPDELACLRRLGAEHEAFFRLIRERKFGPGFCDRMAHEHPANLARAGVLLAPFEEALAGKAFILGRIGLCDFALYGQLHYLAISGQLKIPDQFPNLRAFYGRVDRISSTLDDLGA
ncbi:MAG TPA: glutathione S-transferase family protein [Candidatus Binataceae bacterium]|nr:glutathione S-transferase family protein [Candidatus Binataceae bacterium]HVB80111.1 glutathione S-transferase family protein [Candidatus Binataceae bacterium]